ncbi:hypothetical protein [Haloarchaeobius sp. HRN-SO-5]|uniref:hypothetical protein n=1 Tax=Haloarchaeobius sp. HRN-SO-5 TaxID=3446118 RepID=UPI003EB94903
MAIVSLQPWSAVAAVALQSGPSIDWYVESWFSSPMEVHATELGIFAGLILFLLLLRRHVTTALVLLAFLFVFALGFPDGELLCSARTDNCVYRPVQGKPWYFLLGLLTTLLTSMLLSWRLLPSDDGPTRGELERLRSVLGGGTTLDDAIAYVSRRGPPQSDGGETEDARADDETDDESR